MFRGEATGNACATVAANASTANVVHAGRAGAAAR